MKKLIAYLFVLAMASCMPLAAGGCSAAGLEANAVPALRKEFLANAQGIADEEAAQIVGTALEDSPGALPAPCSWQGDTIIDNGDSTYTIYGRVYGYNYHPSGMSAYFYVEAVKLYNHYGSQFISVGAAGVMASGSGPYSLESGSGVTAQIINNKSQIRLVLRGAYVVNKMAYTFQPFGFRAPMEISEDNTAVFTDVLIANA